jgi:putative membrane protein
MMYRWILALHVIAVISWMAGILYLYRLLIYGSEHRRDHEKVESLLQLMSHKLNKIITIPAMLVSWGAGLWMVYLNSALLGFAWFQIKLAGVILLTIATWYAHRLVKTFNAGEPLPQGKTLRFMNEVPTLLMILIVIMVIIRPWF